MAVRVLVTGATGFIGFALVGKMADAEHFIVRAVARRNGNDFPSGVEQVSVGDLAVDATWQQALAAVNVVVHLAARVHVMCEDAADPLEVFRRVNVDGTLNLARQAAEAGVRRFIFLSSVKVNGEGGSTAYRETDLPDTQDAYGISKHEAEVGLREIAAETGMVVVIIRAPLVYGPGVRANFLALRNAVVRGIPLPFGSIDNRRSMVALDNLLDLIITCIEHPAAANEIFLVSDGEDLSTPDLIRRMACVMGQPARLISVPAAVLMAGATLLGKRDIVRRLCGSLQVDISKTRELLGWTPPISVDEGLRRGCVAESGKS